MRAIQGQARPARRERQSALWVPVFTPSEYPSLAAAPCLHLVLQRRPDMRSGWKLSYRRCFWRVRTRSNGAVLPVVRWKTCDDSRTSGATLLSDADAAQEELENKRSGILGYRRARWGCRLALAWAAAWSIRALLFKGADIHDVA